MAPVPRVKGTQDFYPDGWALQVALREIMLAAGRSYGYQEYEGPAIEYLDLYLGKSSEEIVTQQTFRIQDRDGKALLLRPELTPTLARMIAAREQEIPLPARWQSWGQFYRYERPQRGRGRSFFQWNVDLLGSESAHADAEVIQVACALFASLGLAPDAVQIRLNDRAALEADLTGTFGVPAELVRGVFRVIDRLDKVGDERACAQMVEIGLQQGQAERVVAFVQEPVADPPERLAAIVEQLRISGHDRYVQLDRSIARGFEYYTSTVFEAWAAGDLRRAIFGGGRYDDLTRQVGGKQRVPGVGMAVGDMALLELLRELDRVPAPAPSGARRAGHRVRARAAGGVGPRRRPPSPTWRCRRAGPGSGAAPGTPAPPRRPGRRTVRADHRAGRGGGGYRAGQGPAAAAAGAPAGRRYGRADRPASQPRIAVRHRLSRSSYWRPGVRFALDRSGRFRRNWPWSSPAPALAADGKARCHGRLTLRVSVLYTSDI